MKNQHGIAISPTSETIIRQLDEVLTPHGGDVFVTPDLRDDLFTRMVIIGGTLWTQKVIKAKSARHNECHTISEEIQKDDPSRYLHVYGYALTENDQMWRSHSWIYDQVNDRLIESTPTKRAKYFGVALPTPEAS